jgi:D-alanyl-D-alanine dipeptidase
MRASFSSLTAFPVAVALLFAPAANAARKPTAAGNTTATEPSERVPASFVNINDLTSEIHVELMYAGADNFLARPAAGYGANICYLRREAAEALLRANKKLQRLGRRLDFVLHDCYRPQKAVRDFVHWATDPTPLTPAQQAAKAKYFPGLTKPQLIELNYISPTSGHARGSTVDLAIARRADDGTLRELSMGTIVDFFGERSHTAFTGITHEERANRELLLHVMKAEFRNYEKEWWHFVLINEPQPREVFDFDIASSGRAADAPAGAKSSAPNARAK